MVSVSDAMEDVVRVSSTVMLSTVGSTPPPPLTVFQYVVPSPSVASTCPSVPLVIGKAKFIPVNDGALNVDRPIKTSSATSRLARNTSEQVDLCLKSFFVRLVLLGT